MTATLGTQTGDHVQTPATRGALGTPLLATSFATVAPLALVGTVEPVVWSLFGASAALLAAWHADRRGTVEHRAVCLGEPHRQLTRCRRRQEPAAVFVVDVCDVRHARAVMRTLRLTDSLSASRTTHGFRVIGVIDPGDAEHPAVELRIRMAGGGAVRWSRFPDDGVTLETLVERARPGIGELRLQAAPAVLHPASVTEVAS